LPSLFRIGGYVVFFWSNENNEPIHVHVGRGKPSPGATKIWITSKGGCIIANNNGNISENELLKLLDIIAAQHFIICHEWRKHFNVDTIKYFC